MDNFSDIQADQRADEHASRNVRVFSKKRSGKTDSGQLLQGLETVARGLLDAIADMVILTDLQGSILWANNAASKQLNKSREVLIGASIWDVYPIQKVNHHKILFNEVAITSNPVSFIDSDKDRWIEVSIYPINDDNGELEAIAIQARDINAQIEAEESLKHISLQLITIQENERHRIAQDLHDEIGQQMTALLLELRSVQNAIETNRAVDADQIGGAIRNLETMMKGLRQVFYQLYPPSLHNAALIKVLSAFCSSFARSTGLRVDFSSPDDFPALSSVYEVTLYRFVQEGLANAAKHGKANSVWINLDATDDEINISIEDNGLGFEPKELLPGLGLQGIQERFLMLKGNLQIDSALGKGTKLFGSLPMKTSQI